MAIRQIGLYINGARTDARRLSDAIVEALRSRHMDVCLYYEEKSGDGPHHHFRDVQIAEKAIQPDLILVVGGDGTFLRAAHSVGLSGIPMLGINKGHLGFLSELEEDEFFEQLDRLLAGEFNIERRMMIRAEIIRDGRVVAEALGLNDCVFNRHPEENTIVSDVFLGEAWVDRYKGDGLILATPTGSTGYALSAGGPLIYPGTDCLLVHPICSHFLGSRAVIVPALEAIDVVLRECRAPATFSADGMTVTHLLEGDRLHVTRAEEEIQLVHMREHPFFDAVRNKLLNRHYLRE